MSCSHQTSAPILPISGDAQTSLNSPAFLEFITNLGRVPLLAHHPTCKYYHNHIILVGKLPLCLGCSMMGCGIAAGILLIPHWQFVKDLPFYVLLCIGVFLYIPAVIQIRIQFKAYKMVARFLLGLAVVSLVYAGLWLTPLSLTGWVLKLGFLANFYWVWHLTLKARSHYSTSPCQNCPEGRFPICSYTIPRIPRLANQYFAASDGNNPDADDFVTALQSLYGSNSIN